MNSLKNQAIHTALQGDWNSAISLNQQILQEEPENMGAWPYFARKFRNSDINLDVISRKESSSTATGYAKQHISQQLYIIGKAFEDRAGKEVKKTVVKTTNKAVKVD